MKPTENGIYWAKQENDSNWSLLVFVGGDAPFLRADNIINIYDQGRTGVVYFPELIWGPELVVPNEP